MRDRKRRLENFQPYDYTGIQEHLTKMAGKGWMLEKLTSFGWLYRRCEPQELTFAVTWFSEASDFNPEPTENQKTFYDYCAEAGWQLIAEWAQMQIFCYMPEEGSSLSEVPVPLETEESVKLRNIHRSMKKNYLPSNLVLLAIALLQVGMQLWITDGVVDFITDGTRMFLIVIWMILGLFILGNLVDYGVWYRRSLRSIEEGGGCVENRGGYQKVARTLPIIMVVLLVLWVAYLPEKKFLWGGLLGLLLVTAATTAVYGVKSLMKRRKASRRKNLTATALTCILVSFGSTALLVFFAIAGLTSGLFNDKPTRVYTTTMASGQEWEWEAYDDDIPLKVEDLVATDCQRYSYEREDDASIFAHKITARQDCIPGGEEGPELRYEVLDVKIPFLYNACVEDYLKQKAQWLSRWGENPGSGYVKIETEEIWKAQEVYQVLSGNEPRWEYLVCWERRIVAIDFDWEPTVDQIQIAVQALKPGI